ncbi:MAG TPA: RDD family protein [Microbacterium sp.]|nr:RDD family protein [Microbacterium sp.]
MTDAVNSYPGERLGLPEKGPGSIARPGRRIGALAIDWAAAVIISIAFFQYDSLATLSIFAVVQMLFIPTAGGSPGHRILGMRVVLFAGPGWVGLWRPLVRTLLLVLVIPAVVWDPDQRGLHDKAAGLMLIRA